MIPEDFTDEEREWIVSFEQACLKGENFTEQGPTSRAQQYIVGEFEKIGY